jgi:hypothetical protein
MKKVRVLVFPATGLGRVEVLSRSDDNKKILAQFSAPRGYKLAQAALSLTDDSFVTFDTGSQPCDFERNVILNPQYIRHDQAKTKYGNGVASNFNVIQVSIVNKCSIPIVVPLAGITVTSTQSLADLAKKLENLSTPTKGCEEATVSQMVPLSLDHVTSIYSANRKLTGARAIYFNSIQALATLGSAIEPFFGSGFTKGVAILGGGFTTASKELSVDMSSEQLQNITAQSFGNTEQVSAAGSLPPKFLFIPRDKHCKQSTLENDIRVGNFRVNAQIMAASPQNTGRTSQNAIQEK